jgi:hypothetical protein
MRVSIQLIFGAKNTILAAYLRAFEKIIICLVNRSYDSYMDQMVSLCFVKTKSLETPFRSYSFTL